MKAMHEKLIFEHSAPGRSADAQYPHVPVESLVPTALRRAAPPLLPEVSELQAVRHFSAQLLHRHALLPPRVVHDEIQPEGL
jgi:glycine cleavage system protein P-like pyridoxal-binding family